VKRLISHSEAATLLDCQAKHAFAYTGSLTGGKAIAPKVQPIPLLAGKAWGRAVAELHTGADALVGPDSSLSQRAMRARGALVDSLREDADSQREHGVYDEEAHEALAIELEEILDHYVETSEALPLTNPEHELEVSIPSSGKRKSNLYRLQGFLDGLHRDAEGRLWIVEFKLRKQLTAFEQVVLWRQLRWYSWAWREETGESITGAIVEERLRKAPAPVKLNQDGAPSKVQTCRLDDYIDAWQKLGAEPDAEVVAKLAGKDWQKRHTVLFREGELDEAGKQLVSIGQQIRDLDVGDLYPIRNPSPMRCPGCAFREICPTPDDTDLVDALFERVPAKRDRELIHVA